MNTLYPLIKRTFLLTALAGWMGVLVGCDRSEDQYGEAGEAGDTAAVVAEEPMMPVRTTMVPYGRQDSLQLTGYLAVPQHPDTVAETLNRTPGDTLLPAIIVVHNRNGLDENVQGLTRRLAGEGFVALAVNLFGDNVDTAPGTSRAMLTDGVDEEEGVENVLAAYQYAKTQLKAPAVGIVGWGVGSDLALGSALVTPGDIDAIVLYNGQVVDDDKVLNTLDTPVLAIYGVREGDVSADDARKFDEKLKELGKTAQVQVYENAGPDFADPLGEQYDVNAAEDAWQKTTSFLKQHLYPNTANQPTAMR